MKIKKVIIMLIVIITLSIVFMPKSNATAPSELADQLFQMGYPYGMTEYDKTRIERFINQYGVTDDQSNAIMAKANEALAIFQRTGATNISSTDLNKLKNIAIEAANIVDATLVFTSKRTVDIYKNGVKFDSMTIQPQGDGTGTSSNGSSASSSSLASSGAKLVYTGNDYTIIYIISASAMIIVVLYFIKKKIINEKK